jgi:transcriptional regulator with XRE-family HTH domain
MSARGTCNAKHPVSAGCPDPECYRYDDIPFGSALREARERKKWTQQQLAEAANRMYAGDDDGTEPRFYEEGLCSAQYVSDVENGRRLPKLRRARSFADALDVSLDQLSGREHRRNGERYPWKP